MNRKNEQYEKICLKIVEGMRGKDRSAEKMRNEYEHAYYRTSGSSY